MKLCVYGLWCGLGVLMAITLGKFHLPVAVWVIIYGWAFLGGMWAYYSGKEEGAKTRGRR